MWDPHSVVTPNGVLLCASASTCALVGVATPQELAQRAQDLFNDSVLDQVRANGYAPLRCQCPDMTGHNVALRACFCVIPLAATTQIVVLLEPDISVKSDFLERQHEVEHTYAKIRNAEEQLLQSDKMASIGQLAAGVAHEINNPIGYIHSNLGTLGEYVTNLFRVITAYEKALRGAGSDGDDRRSEITEIKQQVDYEFLVKDLPMLLTESREGIERVRKIVDDLRDFSRAGYSEQWAMADLHRGLDSTLNIVWHDLKYKCDIDKEYGDIPLVECLPSQLNQVFLNILVNAGQAIEGRGTIKVATGRDAESVFVEITDSGKGIPEENLARIFDPFFTTKPVGKGTGLGLSLSYSIVRKHHGRIEVQSRPGHGTTFRVVLPLLQPHLAAAEPVVAQPNQPAAS